MVRIQPSSSQSKTGNADSHGRFSGFDSSTTIDSVSITSTTTSKSNQTKDEFETENRTETAISSKPEASMSDSDSDDEALERSRRFCWGVCCMQGCIWGLIGAIYFFFFLPSGFLLIMYGTNKEIPWAIASGTAILGLSTCGLPSLCICVRWYRRKQRDRQAELRIQRDTQLAKVTFNNPGNMDDEEAS